MTTNRACSGGKEPGPPWPKVCQQTTSPVARRPQLWNAPVLILTSSPTSGSSSARTQPSAIMSQYQQVGVPFSRRAQKLQLPILMAPKRSSDGIFGSFSTQSLETPLYIRVAEEHTVMAQPAGETVAPRQGDEFLSSGRIGQLIVITERLAPYLLPAHGSPIRTKPAGIASSAVDGRELFSLGRGAQLGECGVGYCQPADRRTSLTEAAELKGAAGDGHK